MGNPRLTGELKKAYRNAKAAQKKKDYFLSPERMEAWEKAYWASEERVYEMMKHYIKEYTPFKHLKVADLTIEEWNKVYAFTKLRMSAAGIVLIPCPPTLKDLKIK